MLSEKLQDALNEQVKWEYFSGLQYKAIAGYFDEQNLPGFVNWMDNQAKEEFFHAEKFVSWLCEAGGRTDFRAMDAPTNDFDSPLAAFEFSLNHEEEVSARINNLMTLAKEEGHHALQIFLQWFVNEQVEEEATFGQLVAELKLVEGDGRGLLMLDRELGSRSFTPPAGE